MKECCSQGDCCKDGGPAGDYTIGIAGNPNCGKTTLFNSLTGSRQRVGNWPGVTVERKTGQYRDGSGTLRIIDLPGVYTLGVLPGLEEESLDERLARNHIMDDDLDVLVNIVDASNLERNLYLTAQLIETGRPMVVALNMMDTARQSGLRIDIDALAQALGCPVVPMVAARGEGLVPLLRAVRQVAASGQVPRARVGYAPLLERILEQIEPKVAPAAKEHGVTPRWLAVRLFEGDDLAMKMTGQTGADLRRKLVPAAEAELGEDADILIADGRFSFAHAVARASITRTRQAERRLSDSIDRLVLSRFAGPLIFLAIIYLMFMFTINLGGAFIDFFDQAAAAIFVDGTKAVLGAVGAPLWLEVLLGDGMGGGIQVVATFVPIIGFLYLFLSLIEDSGYMARAAFLMDRLMRVVGLPGKAFVPLIVGFGCNVPAIMSARTLDRERDRIMTVMMSPFMSCGARLTVYALFAAAFFPASSTNIVFALYLIGIGAAIATGFLLKHTLLKGETTPFLMELPPYRLPRLRDVGLAAWVKLKSFIFGAGKIIVIVITILGFLNSFGTDGSFGNEDSRTSVLSAIGRTIIPVFQPMGLHADNWPATVGIFTGVFAKEAVVGTLNALYSGLERAESVNTAPQPAYNLLEKLGAALATIPANLRAAGSLLGDPLGLGQVSSGDAAEAAAAQGVEPGTFGAMVKRFDGTIGAFAYLLFILLYFPCVAALGAVVNEAGRKWAMFAAMWTTGLAYFTSVIFYQSATFARHPATSILWIALLASAMTVFVLSLRWRSRHQQTAPEPALLPTDG